MSVRFKLDWEGLDQFRVYVNQKLPREFRHAMKRALDLAAADGVTRAKQLVAVDTGALQKSIRKEKHAWPAGNVTYIGIRAGGYVRNPRTGRLVHYAQFIEYGTSRTYPRPFMRPALAWGMRRLPNYFWSNLSKRVETK